jgi:hypothetical protein
LNILAGFADISPGQLVLVGGMALLASIIGGLAGYGTGALMPLVLVPLVGAEPVVRRRGHDHCGAAALIGFNA